MVAVSEWLRRVRGGDQHALKGEQVYAAVSDRDRSSLTCVRRINLHSDGIPARDSVEVQGNGRGEQVQFFDDP